ncbi:MAG: 50S ribosomal protein L11 methyltransferase [Bacteroidota bacterium]
MDYIEIAITGLNNLDPGIVIAQLGEMGFESFSESDSGIQAYIREELYEELDVLTYLNNLSVSVGIHYNIEKIAIQNWNALWESEYHPVTVAGKCQVRAPFHPPVPGILYDIVIEPKMSFGTAHHETTSLMLEMTMKEDIAGMRVLDMGCGTGVIAILAAMMKAKSVVAIDTDEWAYANAIENVQRNNIQTIEVIRGDATSIPKPGYDLIIANINRNTLMNDIPAYAANLKQHGVLLMSGFYEEDLQQINVAALDAGFELIWHRIENNWVGVKYRK